VTYYIVPIVEGQTEVGCVQGLLRRVWEELLAGPIPLQVLPPSRGKRDSLVSPSGTALAEKIGEAYSRLSQCLRRDPSGRGLLLLLLDAEGDCPAELAPRLLAVARQARGDATIACVLAKRMLENWIVAGASTLAGVNDLPDPLPARDQFEDRSGAAWLDGQLRSRKRTRRYKKTVDAKVFVRAMDLAECRANCPSFAKLCRELQARLPSGAAPAPDATPESGPPPAAP
jgi:Domain of unknown function (DUF4276)